MLTLRTQEPDPAKVYPPWMMWRCLVKLASMFLMHCCSVYSCGWISTSTTRLSVAYCTRRSPEWWMAKFEKRWRNFMKRIVISVGLSVRYKMEQFRAIS